MAEKELLVSGESEKTMSVTVSNVAVQDWLRRQKESIQPWSDFFNTKKFALPKSVAPVGIRLVKNVERFQSNYVFIFLGLVAVCILTSPVLLVVLATCLGACYFISFKNANNKITVLGYELSVTHQYACVGIVSFILFWGFGAGSAVFSMLGVSLFVIVLHATMYNVEDEVAELFGATMETV
jgi:hypothetical protein